MQEDALTVATSASHLEPGRFSDWVDKRLAATSEILDAVKEQVSNQAIEPLVGARVISCVTGSVFGYEEFHPRGGTPPAEQFLEALNPQLNPRGSYANR